MALPKVTRLRHISARKLEDIENALESLGLRVQIYGQPVWDGKRWTLFFVPPDEDRIDIKSIDL
jgi:hypothetical protein